MNLALSLTVTLVCAQAAQQAIRTMTPWETDLRKRMAQDDWLKPLAAKYPLVTLYSLDLYPRGKQWSYSFVYQTTDAAKDSRDSEIRFIGGKVGSEFEWNLQVGQQNLVICLGSVPFEKNPDPRRIMVNDARIKTQTACAREGEVYLQRVHDARGNNFYVLFQVVAVDSSNRYMAFLWRRLPGGKVVRSAEQPLAHGVARMRPQGKDAIPDMAQRESEVRKRISQDKKLKALARKYPLVLLHSRWMYDRGGSKRSAFNFISETRGGPGGHLLFDNGSPKVLTLNTLNGHQNFAVDLGTADFEQEPELGRISIDGSSVFAADVPAVEGHVYLERVHDSRGNDFFALFQIIHVDPQGRFVALLWRKLPGGSVVKSPD